MPSPLQSARETYLRFVVGADGDSTSCLDGLFVVLGSLRHLPPSASERMEQLYDWFNAELPCPPFSSGKFPVDAVCWFRPSAVRFIQRMWDFANLLREQGQPVRVLKTDKPGRIVYRDEYQVLAVPPTCSGQDHFRISSSQNLGAPSPLRWTRVDRAKRRQKLNAVECWEF